jgi:hypothetical protein
MSSHAASLAVWGAIGAGIVLLWVLSHGPRVPVARPGPIVDRIMGVPAARVVVVLGWMWLGWHTFAR